jgi:hypothetical protein
MTTTESLYNATSFGEFWEHYQELHSHPKTRALHAVATASALGLLALAAARRSVKLAMLAPVVDYGIAQLAHRKIDRIKTQPFRRPVWHMRAEWRLFRSTLRDAEQYLHSRW